MARQPLSEPVRDELILARINACGQPLQRDADLDPLLDRIGEARYVLIGEASHGTHEYYDWRARLSRRLIAEKGFSFVSVEGDWPDCHKVNGYVKSQPQSGATADRVLRTFDRWPTWMWANQDVVDFAEWLRDFNRHNEATVGFYGLDVYSLWDSLEAVVHFLGKADPRAARFAEAAMACFSPYGRQPQAYARATVFDPASCEKEVVDMLVALRHSAQDLRAIDDEGFFDAEQNALIVRNAERYYWTMVRSSAASWNVRDIHMTDTLDRLMKHHGPQAKAIVWAHNTHIGDARATDMRSAGEVNIGQLTRERHGPDGVVLVGFGSHRGSVIAADEWEAPMQRLPVPVAQAGSWEDLMHRAGPQDKLILWPADSPPEELLVTRGHRAIGVVYHPRYERYGNFVATSLAQRYDAFLYLDHTKALSPLHMPERHLGEPPETYPWAV